MTPTTYHRVRDGQQVSEHDAFDERGMLKDGYSMRTKHNLIDGVPVAALTDEQRCNSIDRYNARIGDEWRNIPPTVTDAVVRDAKLAGTLAGIKDPRERAYEKYDAEIQNAWR
jgi:hypothetical protein